MLDVRLRQLQDERTAIEALYAQPLNLANSIAYYMAPQLITLWVITAALLYVLFAGVSATWLHSAWSSVVFSLIGYATRYPIGALVTLSDLHKVSDIEGFRVKNSNAQAKVIALRGSR